MPACSDWSSASSAPRRCCTDATSCLGRLRPPLESLMRLASEELKHQELFRRLERYDERRYAARVHHGRRPQARSRVSCSAGAPGRSWPATARSSYLPGLTMSRHLSRVASCVHSSRTCSSSTRATSGSRSCSTSWSGRPNTRNSPTANATRQSRISSRCWQRWTASCRRNRRLDAHYFLARVAGRRYTPVQARQVKYDDDCGLPLAIHRLRHAARALPSPAHQHDDPRLSTCKS